MRALAVGKPKVCQKTKVLVDTEYAKQIRKKAMPKGFFRFLFKKKITFNYVDSLPKLPVA